MLYLVHVLAHGFDPVLVRSESLERLLERVGDLGDPTLGLFLGTEIGRVALRVDGQGEATLHAVETGGNDDAEGEVDVGGSVDALDLDVVDLAKGVLGHTDRSLFVFVTPSSVDAGPSRVDDTELRSSRRQRDGDHAGEVLQNAGHECLSEFGDAGGLVKVWVDVGAGLDVAERKVDVRSGTGLVGKDLGRESSVETVLVRNGLDAVAHPDGSVGKLHGLHGRGGDFVLAVGTFGVVLVEGCLGCKGRTGWRQSKKEEQPFQRQQKESVILNECQRPSWQ